MPAWPTCSTWDPPRYACFMLAVLQVAAGDLRRVGSAIASAGTSGADHFIFFAQVRAGGWAGTLGGRLLGSAPMHGHWY